MKLIKTLMLASLLLAPLASCASTKLDKMAVAPPMPQLAQPDSALTKDCDLPVDIGGKALTQSQAEGFWIKDRGALVSCRRSKKALHDFYVDRDGRLQGAATGAKK